MCLHSVDVLFIFSLQLLLFHQGLARVEYHSLLFKEACQLKRYIDIYTLLPLGGSSLRQGFLVINSTD